MSELNRLLNLGRVVHSQYVNGAKNKLKLVRDMGVAPISQHWQCRILLTNSSRMVPNTGTAPVFSAYETAVLLLY